MVPVESYLCSIEHAYVRVYVRGAWRDGKVATALGAVRRGEATAVWSGVVWLRFTAGVSRRREPIERAIVATADADVATHRLSGQSCCP